MKSNMRLMGLIAGVWMMIQACTPDRDFSTGKPFDRIEQLAGSWKLKSVTQTDIIARDNAFFDPNRPDLNVRQLDITTLAPYTDLILNFQSEVNNQKGTFTITQGAAPVIFRIPSGNWTLDNLDSPKQVYMINGTDTVKSILGNLPLLTSGTLNLQLVKYQGAKPVIQYDYIFQKTN